MAPRVSRSMLLMWGILVTPGMVALGAFRFDRSCAIR